MQIKLLENNMKPIDAKGKVTTQTLEGNNFLKVDTAFVTGSRNRVFLAPVQQAEKHANMYVNVLEAGGSIDEMHPLQKKLVERGAFQCGFCTPGVVMSMVALLRRKSEPDEKDIKAALQGNLCRCSGYVKLLEAVSESIRETSRER